MFAIFAGIVPLIFAGVARIATAKWKMNTGTDIMTSVLCLVVPPATAFFVANVAFRFDKFFRDLKLSPLMESMTSSFRP